jgi:hypothetical protein
LVSTRLRIKVCGHLSLSFFCHLIGTNWHLLRRLGRHFAGRGRHPVFAEMAVPGRVAAAGLKLATGSFRPETAGFAQNVENTRLANATALDLNSNAVDPMANAPVLMPHAAGLKPTAVNPIATAASPIATAAMPMATAAGLNTAAPGPIATADGPNATAVNPSATVFGQPATAEGLATTAAWMRAAAGK